VRDYTRLRCIFPRCDSSSTSAHGATLKLRYNPVPNDLDSGPRRRASFSESCSPSAAFGLFCPVATCVLPKPRVASCPIKPFQKEMEVRPWPVIRTNSLSPMMKQYATSQKCLCGQGANQARREKLLRALDHAARHYKDSYQKVRRAFFHGLLTGYAVALKLG